MGPDADDIPFPLACRGIYGRVVFARLADGTCPAMEYWESLTDPQKAKYMSLFDKITESPTLRLTNRNQFKQVEGDLFEFKRIDLKARMFTFRHLNDWYLLSGFGSKKEDKLPKSEVNRAKQLMDETKRFLGVK